MSEELKKNINDEALENVDGGMGIPRPKAMDLADDDDSYKWIRIAQADSDDGAII